MILNALRLTIGSLALCLAHAAQAAEAVDFERDIVPIFAKRCVSCHNPSELSGSLDLTHGDGLLAGGDSGSTLVPGSPDESYLVDMVATQQMPPEGKGKPLTDAEIDVITRWVADGAKWPAGRTVSEYEFTTDKRAGKDWWSLLPVTRPEVPAVSNADWATNPIDAFVMAKLDEKKLTPSPEADRRTLLRRAKLDLVGLPPTPEETAEFLADSSPNAYERLIDRLLASPHYGERWARHWLDVVRFAETNGFETNTPRGTAWRYRDYVIESFNADKPYDQFVREQLAGDSLGVDVATGFIVGGPRDEVKSPDPVLTAMQRQDELADMVNTTGTAFLGLTLGCARCHNHKFDPILQTDYYSMQAVFAGVQHGERPMQNDSNGDRQQKVEQLRDQIAQLDRRLGEFGIGQPVNSKHNVERFAPVEARFVRFTIEATTELEPCLDELEVFAVAAEGQQAKNVALESAGTRATSSGDYAGNPKHMLVHVNDGRYGNDYSWISGSLGTGWVQLELPEPARIDRIEWGRDRQEQFRDRLATTYRIEVAMEPGQWTTVASSDNRLPSGGVTGDEIARRLADRGAQQAQEAGRLYDQLQSLRDELVRAEAAATQMVYAGVMSQPGETHRLYRGDPMAPREVVPPGGVSALDSPYTAVDAPEKERRLTLANWIADGDHPLTSRVMANRIWHYHFGTGIVDTPSDFGKMGGNPTHRELLDWLAAEFVEHGWSMKHLHRTIMLSSTYRQSSQPNKEAVAIDAGSRLLWRFPPRRLDAEVIRDSILQASSVLNLQAGGLGFEVFEPNTNYVRVYEPRTSFGPNEWRRAVYMTKVRMEQDATFGAFDVPDAGQVCPKRVTSTTALQALNLLNSPFMLEQCDLLVKRLNEELPEDATARVRRAFELTMGRAPDEVELEAGSQLAREHGENALCRALFNSNEFLWMP